MTLIIQKALLFWIFVRLVFKTRMFQRRSIMPFFFFFLNIHSVEKTDDGKDVEESSKPSFTVSQKRKRIPSTSSLVKPSVSVPSEPHPLSTVNQEAPQPNPVPTKEKQPCSDRYRIYKAQKLREMLKEELRKEKV